ncbi:hypothetical protein PspR76_14810 [Pseudomonas sp. R76]|nr:hypothetical protein PspR76_14810 [Pseudomonas sp. R76]
MQTNHRAHGHACITETALARVIAVRDAAQPHFAYLLANRSATRVKMRVYDGFGGWSAARRFNQDMFLGLAFATAARLN